MTFKFIVVNLIMTLTCICFCFFKNQTVFIVPKEKCDEFNFKVTSPLLWADGTALKSSFEFLSAAVSLPLL